MAVELGFPQYPLSPGNGPNLGCPSGQRGAGLGDPFTRDGWAPVVVKILLFVFAIVTEFAQACLLPSLAGIPCTVITSPIFSVSLLHPFFLRSIGLSNSIAQFVIAFVPLMSTKRCT